MGMLPVRKTLIWSSTCCLTLVNHQSWTPYQSMSHSSHSSLQSLVRPWLLASPQMLENRFQMFTNPNGLSFGNMLPIDEISRLQNRNPEGLSVEALTQNIKTNTWPFKPHQRPTWATNPSAMQSMFCQW